MRDRKQMVLSAILGCALAAGSAWAGGGHEHATPATDEATTIKPYPLETCLVSGEKLGGAMGEPYRIVHGDQEIKFCCKGCVNTFKKDPDKYLKEMAQ